MSTTLIETGFSTDLWQRQAFADTVFLASQYGMPLSPDGELGLYHLMKMRIQAQSMEGSKLGRWLGWAQCAVVAAGVGLTLDDMKAINKRCMDEWPEAKPGVVSPASDVDEEL